MKILSLVHTCDFSSPLRLFCEKMDVEPNCIISRNKIARAQNRKYERAFIQIQRDHCDIIRSF